MPPSATCRNGLVRFALDALERAGGNEAAESVIAYGSFQALPALRDHLGRIFRLSPNGRTYYETYPWRECGITHLGFLSEMVERTASEPKQGLKAWKAMLQTRHPEALAHALAHADPAAGSVPGLSAADIIQAHLHLVGYHRDDRGLRRLCPKALFHLAFPAPYFEGQSRPPWLARVHPTWASGPTDELPPMRFGGQAGGECRLCRGRLHRLIAFEPVPDGIGVSGLGRLELATCLSCLGWERQPLFYRHRQDGTPENVGYDGPEVHPQFPAEPLRETAVRFVGTPRR